jgi:hypothetical protein
MRALKVRKNLPFDKVMVGIICGIIIFLSCIVYIVWLHRKQEKVDKSVFEQSSEDIICDDDAIKPIHLIRLNKVDISTRQLEDCSTVYDLTEGYFLELGNLNVEAASSNKDNEHTFAKHLTFPYLPSIMECSGEESTVFSHVASERSSYHLDSRRSTSTLLFNSSSHLLHSILIDEEDDIYLPEILLPDVEELSIALPDII